MALTLDWPVSYADIAPYYDKAEDFVGVSGNHDGLEHLPDGNYMPPMHLTCGEQLLEKGADKTGRRPSFRPRSHAHRAQAAHDEIRKGLFATIAAIAETDVMWAPCSTPSSSTLPVAAATGKMTLRPNSIVRHIVVDNNTGKARVSPLSIALPVEEQRYWPKSIVVAASTLESTRILLNSKSRHIQGARQFFRSAGPLPRRPLWRHRCVRIISRCSPAEIPLTRMVRLRGSSFRGFAIINKAIKQSSFIRGYGFECGSATAMFPGMARRAIGLWLRVQESGQKVSTLHQWP